ncbi:Holliday junction resolvase RuvX [Virgibacillus halodenitrificans]|jgi:putative holliday junction resolvase|uniref:Putative pre-16S rRNA nuclease n=1 Tax=Virgibacillus halodenitrificans TaxID=1482 RepID=A0AAC9J212_VIRHA|nr:Holliday junction resolvase RuvX [Virgibacillus halodenitrificans]APC48179.1 Holliday junction DNA helicase RuvA [Virgibacillus halodenitrificans]MBD1222886.1 Holliday junction resolvase RuvX [Virgibacillus halodenitrificans]MCG1029966.1 Holliday junction resolvase RuvX [Virgibacillus halodenitrificans]MCJ0930776.1 Holliday junction resolvase RuvX [Virgibacillus halodenitrificans]MEC2160008.1 Holliday junction resolvase RuvX [Virgibacillus halodenitrificans]
MKLIGLDVGSKTIGVAVSDALGWTAQGVKTIKWDENNITSADEELKSIIIEHEIGKAIIGLPKNMNGTIGERGEASQVFAKHMEEVHGIPTVLWDERLTTMAAERVLLEADMSRKKRKKVIDKMAAVMILQGYLDQK